MVSTAASLDPALADIVCGPWFSPAGRAERDDAGIWVCATGVALYLKNVDVAEIVTRLERLEGLGLVRATARSHEGAPCYKPNEALWVVREELFRTRGQRSPVIARSRDHALADVVLAIAVGCARANANPPPGFFAGEPDLLLSELGVMLFDRDPSEIEAAIDVLVGEQLLQRRQRQPANDGRDDGVRSTHRGEIEYDLRVAQRLRLPASANVYRLSQLCDFVVFFAWQSDEKKSRNHLHSALERVVQEANRDWSAGRPIRIETGSMIGDGAVPIDQKIFERIRGAGVVVADFTPVGEFCDTRCPNPNVLVEVGFALGCKEPERIWLIEWLGGDGQVPAGGGKGPYPFDVDKVHRITYGEPAQLRDRLRAELRAVLVRSGLLAAAA